jgi:hypothetical protein
MQNHAGMANLKHWNSPFWKNGWDIRVFGILLVVAGVFDLVWISAYPNYALKVFGTTFEGLTGEFVKYQHPVIHWILGYGFWRQRRWAFFGYLAYLGQTWTIALEND